MDAVMLLPERSFESSSLPTTTGTQGRRDTCAQLQPVSLCWGCITKDHKLWGLSNTCIVLEFWRIEMETEVSLGLGLLRAWRANLFQAVLVASGGLLAIFASP